MSEFSLPANSKVGEGQHWALPKPAEHMKSFQIYRWDPEKNANPQLDTFEMSSGFRAVIFSFLLS
jgi:succinate dehydrogenase / fumarate reductase iron-sulfur subunit